MPTSELIEEVPVRDEKLPKRPASPSFDTPIWGSSSLLNGRGPGARKSGASVTETIDEAPLMLSIDVPGSRGESLGRSRSRRCGI